MVGVRGAEGFSSAPRQLTLFTGRPVQSLLAQEIAHLDPCADPIDALCRAEDAELNRPVHGQPNRPPVAPWVFCEAGLVCFVAEIGPRRVTARSIIGLDDAVDPKSFTVGTIAEIR